MTFTINTQTVIGDSFLKHATITFDAYVTGGLAIVPADFGLNVIDNVLFPSNLLGHKWPVEYDRASKKIIVYTNASPPQQLHNAASMTDLTIDVMVVGK